MFNKIIKCSIFAQNLCMAYNDNKFVEVKSINVQIKSA